MTSTQISSVSKSTGLAAAAADAASSEKTAPKKAPFSIVYLESEVGRYESELFPGRLITVFRSVNFALIANQDLRFAVHWDDLGIGLTTSVNSTAISTPMGECLVYCAKAAYLERMFGPAEIEADTPKNRVWMRRVGDGLAFALHRGEMGPPSMRWASLAFDDQSLAMNLEERAAWAQFAQEHCAWIERQELSEHANLAALPVVNSFAQKSEKEDNEGIEPLSSKGGASKRRAPKSL